MCIVLDFRYAHEELQVVLTLAVCTDVVLAQCYTALRSRRNAGVENGNSPVVRKRIENLRGFMLGCRTPNTVFNKHKYK